MSDKIRFRCVVCGKGARTVTEAENIYATCERTFAVAEGTSDQECEMGDAPKPLMRRK
jgi:hypothetical protein